MSTLSTRELSLHERFSITRRNCGFPHGLTFIFSYSSESSVPTYTQLCSRVEELQKHFPLLWARVIDSKTKNPKFQARQRPWRGEEIVSQATYTVKDDKDLEMERILYESSAGMDKLDDQLDPLWKISILRPQQEEQDSTGSRSYITVAGMHELVDGRGLMNLSLAVVDPGLDISQLPYETIDTIPLLEDTISLKPSLTHLLPVVLRAIVLPRLPYFIQNVFKEITPWPANLIKARPTESPFDLSLLAISPDLVSGLKKAGKSHNVPALHATLQIAYLVAIWAKFENELNPFVLGMATPLAERNPKLSHAYCTANYVSSYSETIVPSSSKSFWQTASELSTTLRSDAGRAAARYSMGMLAYIPDGEQDPSKKETNRPTGWESFFLQGAEGPTPYSIALNMSNLGYIKLPQGCDDAVWGQMASPFGPAFAVDVLGHEAGLKFVTIWRDGSAIDRTQVKEVETVFKKVLERLADEDWNDLTFGGLVA
ncbi:hypothetical protein BCR39DRAFT_494579 [Naematelia encephala]|uniref:Alcohol acetyltransferase n=1 Tax=Naematelia encephala TaxID=71784 RepID=A0A1Y2B6Z5_9TREE|nr:hypothetical protein BCR39DRAFT_494579 [Naematelia encephala]